MLFPVRLLYNRQIGLKVLVVFVSGCVSALLRETSYREVLVVEGV